MAVSSATLETLGREHGVYGEGYFHMGSERASEFIAAIERWSVFGSRDSLEGDCSYRQIIPQIMLVAEGKVAVHTIPKTAGESRLHSLTPFFYGGHIEETEDGKDVMAAAIREFQEETEYGYSKVMSPVGVVSLSDTVVNRVHYGIVYVAFGERPILPTPKDTGVSDVRWLTKSEAYASIATMTPWCRVAAPILFDRYVLAD